MSYTSQLIFGDRALADITKLYIPGVRNSALSRYPTGPDKLSLPDAVSAPPPKILIAGLSVDQPDEEDEEDLIVTLCSVMDLMVQIKEQTTTDDTMHLLLQTIEEGFPEKQADTHNGISHPQIPPLLHRWSGGLQGSSHHPCDEDCLKAAHQGVTMMLSKAEASIFWPGIAADISHHRSTRCCHRICADYFHNKGARVTAQRPCRELAIHIRNLRHSRRYHNRRGSNSLSLRQ